MILIDVTANAISLADKPGVSLSSRKNNRFLRKRVHSGVEGL